MKIKRIYIEDFKNLKNVTARFESEQLVSTIIGKNGAGKSNLIEFIVKIFSDLDRAIYPTYAYELEYSCRKRLTSIYPFDFEETPSLIKISATTSKTKKIVENVSITVNGKPINFKKFTSSKEYLPTHVFGYYSGPSNRLEKYFEAHQEKFREKLRYPEKFNIEEHELPLRPLFYARQIHSLFVLLAFFVDSDVTIKKFLSDHLGIEELKSVLFILNEPPWKGPKNGDPRFWFAQGIVQRFLDKLYICSLAPMTLSYRIKTGLKRAQRREVKCLFLKDDAALKELQANFHTLGDFFKNLESTYISELIYEVKIRVKVRGGNNSLTFKDLSEGEQQLLMVLGLLRFTKDGESLFLLDEPDTHLNPNWSKDYIKFLNEVVGDPQHCQIILGTHSPLVISGLLRDQVQIMRRNDETYEIEAVTPEEDPRGMGIAGILKSDMFGFKTILDEYTTNMLEEKRRLAVKDTLTANERDKLRDLNTYLEDIDFTTSIRDPLYNNYVRIVSLIKNNDELRKDFLNFISNNSNLTGIENLQQIILEQ